MTGFRSDENREGSGGQAPRLRLPRLLGDGCVLRMGRPLHIWGWDCPGTTVLAELLDAKGDVLSAADGQTAADGRFSLRLPPAEAGGPYELSVRDGSGARAVSRDVYIGAVWLVSGQSNIDLDLERCEDSCTDVLRGSGDPLLRTFRIEPEAVFSGPREEPASGRWEAAVEGTLRRFSAVGYFFGAELRALTGLPVGFIHASLGGSAIASWMSKEMLSGFDELLAEADAVAKDGALEALLRREEERQQSWRAALDRSDLGSAGGWKDGFEGQGMIPVPGFFADTPLNGFSGSVWLTRSFEVPREMAGRPAHLWLGTMTDADQTYVNGLLVGETAYQYPPRKYFVPEGCLTAGKNRVVVRLTVENKAGRTTPEKGYFLFSDHGVVDLAGHWDYRVGARMEPLPPGEFPNLRAGGLFNGMTAPCAAFPIDGVVWYQGETDAGRSERYSKLFRRLVEGYRRLWGEEFPFLFVQLPNFSIDLTADSGWPKFRQRQLDALEIPGTAMAVSIDTGEDCDLHPREKRRVGQRLAYLAARRGCGLELEDSGPMPLYARFAAKADSGQRRDVRSGGEGDTIFLALKHAGGLHARDAGKGDVIRDFQLEDRFGGVRQAEAYLTEGGVLLRARESRETAERAVDQATEQPAWVRYVYSNTYHGALLYNEAGLPLSPFRIPVSRGPRRSSGAGPGASWATSPASP